jgi:ATP-dependent RNA helicase DeaD
MTLQINAGYQDGLNPPRLIGLINEQTRNRNIEVGRIEIGESSSFFEIEKQSWEEVLKAFKDVKFEGVSVKVEISGAQQKARPKYRSNDRGNYKSDDRPRYKSGDRPAHKSDDRPRYKADDRPKHLSDDRPKYKSDDRPKYKSDDRANDKPKPWSNELSGDWSKDKRKGKANGWSKDKPKGKSNSGSFNKPKETYGGKRNKKSPYKNW